MFPKTIKAPFLLLIKRNKILNDYNSLSEEELSLFISDKLIGNDVVDIKKNSKNKMVLITSDIARPSIPSIKLMAFTITKKTNTKAKSTVLKRIKERRKLVL